MTTEKSPVKGRELRTISTTHAGEVAETSLTVQFSIHQGDLRLLCDLDARHASVHIFIASADDTVAPAERESIEVDFSKEGTSKIRGFEGDGVEISNGEELVLEKPVEIDKKSSNSRWQVCGFIPFFYLPSPGSIEGDEFLLKWTINVTSRDLVSNQILSLVKLRGDNNSDEFNPHQIEKFEELIISDADALRLRSVSRSSVSRMSRASQHKPTNIAKFLFELESSDEVQQARAAVVGQGTAFDYCESTADVTKALRSLYPLSPKERVFATSRAQEGCEGSSDEIELSKKLLPLLRQEEQVLRAVKLWCRHGWNHQKVLLVLSADAVDSRLHMFNRRTKKFIRTIPWSITKPVTAVSVSDERFDLEFIDTISNGTGGGTEVRVTYHFLDQHDAKSSVESLVTSLQAIAYVQDRYVRERLGSGEHAVLRANLRRTRKESVFDQYCAIT